MALAYQDTVHNEEGAPINLGSLFSDDLRTFVLANIKEEKFSEIFSGDPRDALVQLVNNSDLHLSDEELKFVDEHTNAGLTVESMELGLDYSNIDSNSKKAILEVIAKFAKVAGIDISEEYALKSRILNTVMKTVVEIVLGEDRDLVQTEA
ncbi:MAG: hypothetical protein ABIM99_03215 [Candidatus Dojkabacteria bacterium]